MPLDSNANAQLACMAFYKDSAVFYNATIISGSGNVWKKVSLFTGLPFDEDKNFLVKIFIMNKEKQRFYFKNLKVVLN